MPGRKAPTLQDVASGTWEISPAQTRLSRPSYALPGQLERVTHFQFSGVDPQSDLAGGREVFHTATRAHLLRDATLFDGCLYKGGFSLWLHPRTSLPIVPRLEQEIDRAALYSTTSGSRYFGNWLIDDCVTYPLAVQHGTPITTTKMFEPHMTGYETLLGMRPQRCKSAYMHEVVVFEDFGLNANKALRSRRLREALIATVGDPVRPHPGVFLQRGGTGERRLLLNELELAEQLARTRGLRIVNPAQMTAAEIVEACAGSQIVVGVEGSQLFHAFAVLAPGACVLTLQPPMRFVTWIKNLTDCQDQHFGYVVGLPRGSDFWVDPDEVERTFDLLLDAAP